MIPSYMVAIGVFRSGIWVRFRAGASNRVIGPQFRRVAMCKVGHSDWVSHGDWCSVQIFPRSIPGLLFELMFVAMDDNSSKQHNE